MEGQGQDQHLPQHLHHGAWRDRAESVEDGRAAAAPAAEASRGAGCAGGRGECWPRDAFGGRRGVHKSAKCERVRGEREDEGREKREMGKGAIIRLGTSCGMRIKGLGNTGLGRDQAGPRGISSRFKMPQSSGPSATFCDLLHKGHRSHSGLMGTWHATQSTWGPWYSSSSPPSSSRPHSPPSAWAPASLGM